MSDSIQSARKRAAAPFAAASAAVKRTAPQTPANASSRQPGSSLFRLPEGDNAEVQFDFEDGSSHVEEPARVIMAFLHEGSQAGIAFYSTETGALCANATPCTDADVGYLIEVIKKQITDVSLILTTSRVSEPTRLELGRGDDGSEVAISVEIVKHSTFGLELSRKLLEAVQVDGNRTGGASSSLSSVRVSSFLDSNSPMLIRVAGGLLHYLVRSKIVNEMESSDSPLVLPGGMRMFNISDFMLMDTLSFTALSIFADEGHPNVIRSSGKSKEGFSVCALLDRAASPGGKKLLRAWCRQPSTDIEVLCHRHDAVEFCMAARAQLPEIWKEYKGHLKRVKDVPRLLLRIRTVKATPGDWFTLQESIISANMIKETVHLLLTNVRAKGAGESADHVSSSSSSTAPYSAAAPFLLRQVQEEFSSELSLLQTTVNAVIDWEGSRQLQTRLCVNSGLDTTLDEYRRTYADLPDFLSSESFSELQKYPSLASISMKYVPQIGIVAVIDKAENGLAPATADYNAAGVAPGQSTHALVTMSDSRRAAATVPSEFILQFETSTALHYKTPRAAELDVYFGDIAAVIADLEGSIVRQLEKKVLEYDVLLHNVSARLSELDVLAAFAETSQDFRYVRPQMVDDNVLLVKNARHPLQELTVETFVPNDIALSPGQPGAGAVAIVTGPNYSGKSVYLKTVGLIPYMAQIGCFVPAERAVLGIVDRLFTRLHSAETSSVNQSSFTIDLSQVGLMLRHATPRSLLLIDEFGKGTSSIDGVSLLAATIRSLLLFPCSPPPSTGAAVDGHATGAAGPSSPAPLGEQTAVLPPKTVITTHFREVFDFDLLGIHQEEAAHLGAGAAAAPSAPDGVKAIPGLRPLPPAAAAEVAFFQMSIILDSGPVAAGGHGAGDGAEDDFFFGEQHRSSEAAGATAGGAPEQHEYDDHVVPLFKLVSGRATSSYGHACARKAGVSAALLARAHQVTDNLREGKQVPRAPKNPLVGTSATSVELACLELALLILQPSAALVDALAAGAAPAQDDIDGGDRALGWESSAVAPEERVYTAVRAVQDVLA